jgi:hypothetical protein
VSDQSAEVVEFSKFYMENVPRLIAFLVCQGVSVMDAADWPTGSFQRKNNENAG